MSSKKKIYLPSPIIAKNVEHQDEASDISGANSVMFDFNVRFTNMENNIQSLREHVLSTRENMIHIHNDAEKIKMIQELHDDGDGPNPTLTNESSSNYYRLDQTPNSRNNYHDDISTLSSRIGRNGRKKTPELMSKSIQLLHFSLFTVLFCTFAWFFSFVKNIGVKQSVLVVLPLASCPICAVTSYYNILSIRNLRELESIVLSVSSFVLVIASYTARIIKNCTDQNKNDHGTISVDAGSLLVFFVLGIVNLVLSLQYNQYLGSKPRHEEIEEKFLVK